MDPVVEPLHKMLVTELIVTVGAPLLLTVAVPVPVHPLASVMVTLYTPAISPVAVCVDCEGVVAQLYVYDPVPPAGVAVAVPVPEPQFVFVVDVPTVMAAGAVSVAVAVLIHPFASVMVTVCVPAPNPVAVAVVCAGEVFHEYVYAPVPPIGFAVADPLVAPLHVGLTGVVEAVSADGCVMIAMVVSLHPELLTVAVYVPAASEVAEGVF